MLALSPMADQLGLWSDMCDEETLARRLTRGALRLGQNSSGSASRDFSLDLAALHPCESTSRGFRLRNFAGDLDFDQMECPCRTLVPRPRVGRRLSLPSDEECRSGSGRQNPPHLVSSRRSERLTPRLTLLKEPVSLTSN